MKPNLVRVVADRLDDLGINAPHDELMELTAAYEVLVKWFESLDSAELAAPEPAFIPDESESR